MPAERGLRCGIYARVSTADQRCEGQLEMVRRFADASSWHATEYIGHGVSGAKERRPALDALVFAARRRDVAVVIVTKLDRLARSLHQLLAIASELAALGVDLVVLDQAIDMIPPSGRLLFHVFGSVAEFERDLIHERVVAGRRRAQERGTRSGLPIGRPRRVVDAEEARRRRAAGEPRRKIPKAVKTPVRSLERCGGACQSDSAEPNPN
jgi:DNA invertase Pin-like site-specific DNA recombinase